MLCLTLLSDTCPTSHKIPRLTAARRWVPQEARPWTTFRRWEKQTKLSTEIPPALSTAPFVPQPTHQVAVGSVQTCIVLGALQPFLKMWIRERTVANLCA